MEVIDTIEIEDIPTSKIISDREGEIIAAIVGMNVQKDVALLFKRMSAIPISRRMSIMPGFPMEDDVKSVISRKVRYIFCLFVPRIVPTYLLCFIFRALVNLRLRHRVKKTLNSKLNMVQ